MKRKCNGIEFEVTWIDQGRGMLGRVHTLDAHRTAEKASQEDNWLHAQVHPSIAAGESDTVLWVGVLSAIPSGHRYGDLLIQEIHRFALASGYSTVALESSPTDGLTQASLDRFYARHGYKHEAGSRMTFKFR